MRNHSLDILKALMAFCVVVIHCHCAYTDTLSPLTGCAVPVFFAISGYCIYGNNVHDKVWKSLKRMMVIFAWSTILYGAFFAYKTFAHSDYTLSQDFILRFLVFNDHPFIYHLWYINAYIYVLVILWIITCCKKWENFLYVFPLLLLSNMALGRYDFLCFGNISSKQIILPFLFKGLPFFLMGMTIKKFHNRLVVNRGGKYQQVTSNHTSADYLLNF